MPVCLEIVNWRDAKLGKFQGRGQLTVSLESLLRRVAGEMTRAGLCFGHGTNNAVDEAYWLVLHAAGLAVDQPVQDYSLVLNDPIVERVDNLLAARIQQRQPLAYLLNSAWFAGLEFFVDKRVLVPRSPIAELILDSFSSWLEPSEVHSVLDLCTGSGCIAIACAYAFPEARVVASDISRDALAVATVNTDHHQLTERLTLVESDVFQNITGRFDLIVSNPPYVDSHEMAHLPDEFRCEPAVGLAAGDDGLTIVDSILSASQRHLSPRGVLVVEVGSSALALRRKYPQLPFLWLSFESGGDGVFLLTAEELRQVRV